MSGRPIVVLGGWLGCQRRSLRRYEDIYKRLGFDVLSYIPEPRIVVDSALRSRPIRVPKQWPAQLPEQPESMQEMSWHILGSIHKKQSSVFLYHGFSNGGCFLWESMRKILDYNTSASCQQPAKEILETLKARTKGVVFDSCPAWFGEPPSSLRAALQYCTKSEKLGILMRFGPSVILYDGQAVMEQQNQRNRDFFRYLHEDPLDIPQLYLNSKSDPITNFEKMDELFRHRRSIQKSPVLQQTWDESAHVSHLRSHPKEYKQAINMFTEMSLLRSKL